VNREARIPRFFQPGNINIGDQLELEKRISHHLITVLRARDNSQVMLFNEHGGDYLCSLTLAGKRARAHVISEQESASESPIHTTLVQAISRGSNMDTCIQKSVELGVNVIQPIYTRHSVPTLQGNRAEKKHAHWQSVIVSASEQSGRSTIAELGQAMPMQQYLDQRTEQDNELRWLLSPASDTTRDADAKAYKRATVVIGPESGFDADECDIIKSYGFKEQLLGPRILRTETAGPVAIAVLQTRYGDFK
jgi:16S rRNA (uracil1498-N3)-methyltransferase